MAYNTDRSARCPSCWEYKNEFVWSPEGTLLCLDCANPTPKTDWLQLALEVAEGLQPRTCPSCGGLRRHFVESGDCLKCDGERIATELIASGPWGIIHD
jgi:hypothetical protein